MDNTSVGDCVQKNSSNLGYRFLNRVETVDVTELRSRVDEAILDGEGFRTQEFVLEQNLSSVEGIVTGQGTFVGGQAHTGRRSSRLERVNRERAVLRSD